MIKDSELLKLLHALNNNKINISVKIRVKWGVIKIKRGRKLERRGKKKTKKNKDAH